MDTIVAVSTPRGRAARGVVRLSGPRAVALVTPLFSADPKELPLEGLRRGMTDGVLRMGDTGIGSPVRIVVQRGPRSYTGEDVVELHLHGAPILLETTQDLLVRAGARAAEPGEFTRRAFLAGRIDLAQAEAVHAVIAATDAEERRRALAVLEGGLSKRLAVVRERILRVLIPLELSLDFSDQDVDIDLPLDALEDLERGGHELQALLDGPSVRTPRRDAYLVALVGPANAGKSSLFNRVLGQDTAMVSSVPGTTRDVLRGEVTHAKLRLWILDTAGRGVTGTRADEEAHRLRERRVREADVIVEVRDGREPLPPRRDAGCLWVETHQDLIESPRTEGVCRVSSVTGEGVGEFLDAVVRTLASGSGASAPPVLVSTRHRLALESALTALGRARQGLTPVRDSELIAADLHGALEELARITGEGATDAVLDRIFREFCIGK